MISTTPREPCESRTVRGLPVQLPTRSPTRTEPSSAEQPPLSFGTVHAWPVG
ncbi:MAG: hypothetical protein KF850_00465 [Labilithrix sp.]|nr:hypothetical protein [Labilithrix sp.]